MNTVPSGPALDAGIGPRCEVRRAVGRPSGAATSDGSMRRAVLRLRRRAAKRDHLETSSPRRSVMSGHDHTVSRVSGGVTGEPSET